MYNEERKRLFMEQTNRDNDATARSILNRFTETEEAYGMDLSLLPMIAIQNVVDDIGLRSSGSDGALVILRAYFKWSRDAGYEVGDGLDGLVVNKESKMAEMMVSSPFHLETLLNKVFSPVKDETVDCLYRCYLWMAFAGIEQRAAVDVKTSEVDLSGMMIHIGSEDYDLYKEAMPAFRKACKLKDFLYIHSNHPRYSIRRERLESEYLMRGVRSAKPTDRTTRSIVSRTLSSHGLKISYRNIALSGIFYRAYEMERAGFKPDFSGPIMRRMADKTYADAAKRKAAICMMERGYKIDYEAWKRAFA